MVITAPTRLFTSLEVCGLAGVSYRQLDHWTRQGYLTPTPPQRNLRGDGTGFARAWSEREAVKAVAMASMVRAGITHAKAAELVAACLFATLHVTPLGEGLS